MTVLLAGGTAARAPKGGLPLTAAQLGMWYAQSLDPLSPAQNTAEYLEIDGPVDPGVFATALRRVVAETDALRVCVKDGPDGGGALAQPPGLAGACDGHRGQPRPGLHPRAGDAGPAARRHRSRARGAAGGTGRLIRRRRLRPAPGQEGTAVPGDSDSTRPPAGSVRLHRESRPPLNPW